MNIPAENQVAQLISLLPPDIVQLIAREPEEDEKKCEYALGNKTAQLLKDKPFLNLEKINAIMTRFQAKRSSDEDRNKEAEMGQTEEMMYFEIVEEFCHKLMKNIRKLRH
ncbi:hypothetical protein AVEN_117909-1 [Araneus ventricosus]|uniref:Uncharacterized protein n=1 Tax=Araneus ventricosus TaxID=182803 RepID=A0A4Y2JAI8_ARAVE|nr:hypothetical protein AVEN_117909-1 [Araneus ventricosus]